VETLSRFTQRDLILIREMMHVEKNSDQIIPLADYKGAHCEKGWPCFFDTSLRAAQYDTSNLLERASTIRESCGLHCRTRPRLFDFDPSSKALALMIKACAIRTDLGNDTCVRHCQ
jgi:hypothetical protein